MKLQELLFFLGYSLGYCYAQKFDRSNCGRGYSGVKNLIINGSPATPGSYPWMVSVRGLTSGSEEYYCGGSILSENWVLTAAHCVTHANIVDVEVYAGIYFNDNRDEGQVVKASEVFIPEQYSEGNKDYDIALIKTSSSINFGEYVGSICLPSENYYPSGEATVIGWGATAYDYYAEPADELMEATLSVLPEENCETNSNVTICASWEEASVCKGDSGGPLFQYDRTGKAIIIGITSRGDCIPGSQAIFTRVSAFLDWIEEISD